MIRDIKTRSTDLNVLRSLLSDDTEPSTNHINEINFENEVDYNYNVKDKLDNSENNVLDLKTDGVAPKNLKLKSKIQKEESTSRQPFFVARINTHHKYNDTNRMKSIDDESGNVYKSVHYKNIIHKEERLQNKYLQLAELLEKDVVARTSAICDQSMNEARQLIQNSLAASRIVSSFLSDTRYLGLNNVKQETAHDIRQSQEGSANLHDSTTLSSNDLVHPLLTNNMKTLYEYDISTPIRDSLLKIRTDNRLNSDELFIQQWLQNKEKEEHEQIRMKRRQRRIERQVTMNADRVLEERKAAAKEAYITWRRQKIQETKKTPTTYQSEISEEEVEESFPQAGRQPRPKHNFVYRRPTQSLARPKTTATFTIRTDLRLKLTGQRVDLSVADTSRSLAAVRLQPTLFTTVNSERKNRPQTAVPGPRPDVSTKMSNKYRSKKHSPVRSTKTRKRRVTLEQRHTDPSANRENMQPEIVATEDEIPDNVDDDVGNDNDDEYEIDFD